MSITGKMKIIRMGRYSLVPDLSLAFLNRNLKSAQQKYLGGLLKFAAVSSQASYSNRNKGWKETKYLQ